MTKDDICSGIACLETIITLIETKIITVVRLAVEIVKEVGAAEWRED